MENYKGIASDAPNAYNAFDATVTKTEDSYNNKAWHQGIKIELEEDNMLNVEVLKETSSNISK